MKKFLIIACCIMVSVAFVSCTNDEDLKLNKAEFKTSADGAPDPTGGDQTGQIPVPRPK